MKTLTQQYKHLMALYLDQLMSAGWETQMIAQKIVAQKHLVLRAERRLNSSPDAMRLAVDKMLELIQTQLELTLPATQRMTTYRNSAQHCDYDRALVFRSGLLEEQRRLDALKHPLVVHVHAA